MLSLPAITDFTSLPSFHASFSFSRGDPCPWRGGKTFISCCSKALPILTGHELPFPLGSQVFTAHCTVHKDQRGVPQKEGKMNLCCTGVPQKEGKTNPSCTGSPLAQRAAHKKTSVGLRMPQCSIFIAVKKNSWERIMKNILLKPVQALQNGKKHL